MQCFFIGKKNLYNTYTHIYTCVCLPCMYTLFSCGNIHKKQRRVITYWDYGHPYNVGLEILY